MNRYGSMLTDAIGAAAFLVIFTLALAMVAGQ
jgi:hypothetical protein